MISEGGLCILNIFCWWQSIAKWKHRRSFRMCLRINHREWVVNRTNETRVHPAVLCCCMWSVLYPVCLRNYVGFLWLEHGSNFITCYEIWGKYTVCPAFSPHSLGGVHRFALMLKLQISEPFTFVIKWIAITVCNSAWKQRGFSKCCTYFHIKSR